VTRVPPGRDHEASDQEDAFDYDYFDREPFVLTKETFSALSQLPDDPSAIVKLLGLQPEDFAAANDLALDEEAMIQLEALKAVAPVTSGRFMGWNAATERRGDRPLSSRERQILTLVIEGKTSKEVAYDLHIAHSTVRILYSRAMKKLGGLWAPKPK
jgi:hypothetical protein